MCFKLAMFGEQGGVVEQNVLHDQKVVGSNPASTGVLSPWARCFIPSWFTPPTIIEKSVGMI